jgi:large subunit ribosomal protein L13
MLKLTKATKISEIQREWHLIDIKGETLGRVASRIAQLLMGKSKAYFVRNLDCGDYVVVINAKDVITTGNKEKQKEYYRHSGYPGGFRRETLEKLRIRRPEEVIRRSVSGMVPQNRLKASMLKRLYVFPTEVHTYKDKFEKPAKGEVHEAEVKTEEVAK